jgi:hypothetical protein
VKEVVLVDPKGALTVHLAKVVKVELPHQRLETRMPEVLRQSFGLEFIQIRSNLEGIAIGSPLFGGKKPTIREILICDVTVMR